MRKSHLYFSLIILILSACSSVSISSQTSTIENKALHLNAFTALKNLVGTYTEIADEKDAARVDYKLIARGSALMETWNMPNGSIELTIFHMDKNILIATHYCAAGAQTTMQLDSSQSDGVYNFIYKSVTNLSNPGDAYNSGFGYQFSERSKIKRTETWTKENNISDSSLILQREI